MLLPLALQFISPFELREAILSCNEYVLQVIIEQLKEKRNNSLGKDYSKYTKEITMLNGCLKECKIKNSINHLKESNKNY
jgi:hypothetical protein